MKQTVEYVRALRNVQGIVEDTELTDDEKYDLLKRLLGDIVLISMLIDGEITTARDALVAAYVKLRGA